MSIQAQPSSNSTFSYLDGIAAGATDLWLLIGRVLLCWVFMAVGWGHITNAAGFAGYLTNLNVPAPLVLAWIGAIAEIVIGLTLLFGVATRYGAALGIIFVICATALAHRYWEYPAAQVGNQWNHFLKNIAIIGGLFYVFVFGPGRYSVDNMISRR